MQIAATCQKWSLPYAYVLKATFKREHRTDKNNYK